MKPCLTCGALGPGTRCRPCQQAKKRDLYGPAHRRTRAQWEPAVNTGTVTCARCHLPIAAPDWDLGHHTNAPEHAHCNRSAGASNT